MKRGREGSADDGALAKKSRRDCDEKSVIAEMIPCNVCGKSVDFSLWSDHAALHNGASPSLGHGKVEKHTGSASRAPKQDQIVTVPCERCGDLVPFDDYMAHSCSGRALTVSTSNSKFAIDVPCEVKGCSALVPSCDYKDHVARHAREEEERQFRLLQDSDGLSSGAYQQQYTRALNGQLARGALSVEEFDREKAKLKCSLDQKDGQFAAGMTYDVCLCHVSVLTFPEKVCVR